MIRICRLLTVVIASLLALGCTSALHAPQDVDALIATRPATDVPARNLLVQADEAFSDRTLPSARQAFDLALRAASDPEHRVAGALTSVRAAIWIASHSEDADERDRSSSDAVRAAQLCAQAAPDEVRCHYWLALALGVQARERRATALDALPKIIRLLEAVAVKKPELEYAGAHRALALLYLRAPGWPGGPGDADLGLEHARRAVALAGDYPPNLMSLAEGLESIEDSEESVRVYAEAAELASRWRDRGEPDASEWLERAEKRSGLR